MESKGWGIIKYPNIIVEVSKGGNNMETVNNEEKEMDEKIIKLLDESQKNRVDLYEEALKRLIKKDNEFEKLISNKDIKKLATYKDEDISNRVEIRALKQERQRMLDEEKQKLANELTQKVGIGMEKSINVANTAIKGVLLGLFGGPIGITMIAFKEIISAQQTKGQLKESILESIENGNETNVHNLIAQKDREYGKLLNFDGFLEFVKKSDVFQELNTNQEEKKKIEESMKEVSREAFKMFSELEEYKDEKVFEKEMEKFEEDEEDPEPEPGMKYMI